MKKEIKDTRFERVHNDPRFATVFQSKLKHKVDKRFQKMFHDSAFTKHISGKVDQYGKQIKKVQDSYLNKYYEKPEENESSKLEEFQWNEKSSDEEEEEEIENQEEIQEEEEPPLGDESKRLAVLNCDWKVVTATDLLVIFTSFLPPNGRIEKVSIFPSEYGYKIMQQEVAQGPNIKEDDEEEIRKYELNTLKYYYAVLECDSIQTASFLYGQCDGIEIEASSNSLDLRFIPDQTEFPYEPKETATEIPKNYYNNHLTSYFTRALQHSRVELSWDQNSVSRQKAFK